MKKINWSNCFENSTKTNCFDLSLNEGRSYGHYLITKVIKAKKLILINKDKYSITTAKHIYNQYHLLIDLYPNYRIQYFYPYLIKKTVLKEKIEKLQKTNKKTKVYQIRYNEIKDMFKSNSLLKANYLK